MAVGVLAIVGAIFFLLRRRKREKAQAGAAAAAVAVGDSEGKGGARNTEAKANPIVEAPTNDTGAREVEGFTPVPPQTSPSELDGTGPYTYPSPSAYPMSATTLAESPVSHWSPGGETQRESAKRQM